MQSRKAFKRTNLISINCSLAELLFLVLFLKRTKLISINCSLAELMFLVLFLKKNKTNFN
jgi:hypothetical protein